MGEHLRSEVTFEDGYEELKRIVARLDAEDVTVHEMCELFARGKGLERALRGYLETQKGKLDEIEAGENLPEFTIIAPSFPLVAAPPADQSRPAQAPFDSPPGVDDDIPF
ncbi:MAG TPA: exodeoxyribonuclease VII small subunit [Solirubrobacteraceae bacterium]|jgi:exodeoxyribonuclease VII small subunit|nr:exodeoxyribonuclease VII small subunit [Solirubrobacteraceae bacterium]